MEYASKGVATAGLTTGIIGTALGALSGGNGGGLLSGLLGGNRPINSDDEAVTRYEMHMHEEIAEKDEHIAKLESEKYTDTQIAQLANSVNTRFTNVEGQLAQQAVYNATANGTISCIQRQIAQLQGITQIVVPNSNVMPGWGAVTVSPATTTTKTAATSTT